MQTDLRLPPRRMFYAAAVGFVWISAVATAQTFNVLKEFSGTNGAHPQASLTFHDGVLYGTTSGGGSANEGTIFKLNADGAGFMVLKHLSGRAADWLGYLTNSDGVQPFAGLTLSENMLYGTAFAGGSSGWGTVFRINTDGSEFTVLKHFGFGDTGFPRAGVIPAAGVLYGTTSSGGGSGGVFRVNTDGTDFVVLKRFAWNDGSPYAGLALSGTTLYGAIMSDVGFDTHAGRLFKLQTDGTDFSVFKEFSGSDGYDPKSGLVLADNVLYGTTYKGGSSHYGTVFKVNTDGTGHTVLKNFSGLDNNTFINTGGAHPLVLTLAGSVLYGTTEAGGSSAGGTVFKVNTDGTGFVVLKNFDRVFDNGFGIYTNTGGSGPSGLVSAGGVLYGTTQGGGSSGFGTVFRLELPTRLIAQALGNAVVLSWDDPTFALQSAPNVTGIYTNLPEATSPYTNLVAEPQRFFRLVRP